MTEEAKDTKETEEGENEPNKTKEDEIDEEAENEEGIIESKSFGSFFSPEGMIIFPLAVLLDLIGLILVFFALDDFFITDIVGIVMIGGWTYFHSGQVQMTQGAQQKLGKMAKRMRRLKWLRPLMIIGEFIPYVGALPCWTILVYFELKSS